MCALRAEADETELIRDTTGPGNGSPTSRRRTSRLVVRKSRDVVLRIDRRGTGQVAFSEALGVFAVGVLNTGSACTRMETPKALANSLLLWRRQAAYECAAASLAAR